MERTCGFCGKYLKTNAAFTRHLSECRVKFGFERRRLPRPKAEVDCSSGDEHHEKSESRELEPKSCPQLETTEDGDHCDDNDSVFDNVSAFYVTTNLQLSDFVALLPSTDTGS